MSVYIRIRSKYDALSKSEQRVAKYCLDNYLDIGDLSLAQLAENAGCGEATVFRFCHKIGIESFNDFKTEINDEVKDSFKKDENSYVTDIYESIQSAIEYAIQNLDQNQLTEIATIINNANVVFCAGVGNSGVPAEACAMRLLRNGTNSTFIKDTHFQSIYLAQLTQKDVAILFSDTGESTDIMHLANIIKARGVPIVSITSSVVSSLARLSDYHLLIKNKRGALSGGNMITQISMLYISDVITTRVGMIDSKKTGRALEQTYEYIHNKTRRFQ